MRFVPNKTDEQQVALILVSIRDQSSRNSAKTLARNAANLRQAAHNLAAIADSAEAVLRMSETPPSKRKKAR
jgi:hypothetical protein